MHLKRDKLNEETTKQNFTECNFKKETTDVCELMSIASPPLRCKHGIDKDIQNRRLANKLELRLSFKFRRKQIHRNSPA